MKPAGGDHRQEEGQPAHTEGAISHVGLSGEGGTQPPLGMLADMLWVGEEGHISPWEDVDQVEALAPGRVQSQAQAGSDQCRVTPGTHLVRSRQ